MQCQIFSAVRISQSQVGGETRDLVSGSDTLFKACSKKWVFYTFKQQLLNDVKKIK